MSSAVSQTGLSAGHTDAEFPVYLSVFLISTLNPPKIMNPCLTISCYLWLGFTLGGTSRSQLNWHFATGLPSGAGACVATGPVTKRV